jgi:Cytochrome c3
MRMLRRFVSFAGASVLAASPTVFAEEQEAGKAEAPLAENTLCLDCHGDEELAPSMTLKSGDKMVLYVDPEQLPASVHAKLGCVDCHADLKSATADGHESTRLGSAREFTIKFSEHCKECHFDNYTKTLDSVHHALIAKGELKAAVCSDCHGSHAVKRPGEPRSAISKACGKCHANVVAVYTTSVHGQALTNDNPDVPACTDCHRSHDIADPRAGAWRLNTPAMCGACHTNAAMMKKYGLSTSVVSTYLADFHGATAVLQQKEKGAQPVVALCTDCHGVHDITQADAPGSKVVQANLVKTCQKCHPDATENFPASWLSHYEPTWKKAPLVFAVKVFYQVLIPFMIGGLLLQIALHLWRVVVNR